MGKDELAVQIRDKALELGFDACGIIRLDALRGYEAVLAERSDCLPPAGPIRDFVLQLARPQGKYGWAKAVVVCLLEYGRYKVPQHLEGLFGKYYLFDYKLQRQSQEWQRSADFDAYLQAAGLQAAREINGVAPGRWAAATAGLGVIGRNNFLYTEHGSWCSIETWVIDQELELVTTSTLSGCPAGCRRCLDACPTGALGQPHRTRILDCVTRQTWGIAELPSPPVREKMGKWLCGCDLCQEVCPLNRGKWTAEKEFPGLAELAAHLSPQQLLRSQDETVKNQMLAKFWLFRPERFYLWKVNALRAIANTGETGSDDAIRAAVQDEQPLVREMAAWAAEKLAIRL